MDSSSSSKQEAYKVEIVWRQVLTMSLLHLGALAGLAECLQGHVQWKTMALAYLLYQLGGVGVMAGAHRFYSHRSFKARWPLRLLLVCLQSLAFENSCYEWARDHRIHHKYSETDADPHNVKRGFFFAHMGWLLCRKHPQVRLMGKQVDLSDLHADPICMFQHKHYLLSVSVFCFALPTLTPYLLWSESLYNAFLVCALLRYAATLHSTWLINSAAHLWGRRPYDKNMNPAENRWVSFWAQGEGFHNFHHTFPFDYAASELGYELNLSKLFIDAFAALGWAYERKVVSPEMIKQRKLRTGDVHELGAYGPHNPAQLAK